MTKLLSMKAVCERTSLSRATIDRKVDAGQFPQKVRLGQFRVAFLEEEVEAWIQDRIDATQ